jgi:hypothetical protein
MGGTLIFPLWKFWTYSPHGFVAAIVWNICELSRVPCPFAPTLFGWIIGHKGKRTS